VVNFENTVIVMTSNAGSEGRVGTFGFGRTEQEQVKEKAIGALREFLRPEFINRVDDVIVFNRLTKENFLGIADIMLKELKDSLAGRGLTLSWDESLGNYLAEKAYSPVYGARNLRRTIQRLLEDPISERIIDSFEVPISAIHAYVDGGEVQLQTQ
jgi:ATP-dependent Clp protease ATP-binding subunit ClpA